MDQTEIYYTVLRDRLLSQEWLNRELGTKAAAMMAFGGAIVGVGAVILNVDDIPQLIVFGVLITSFVAAAILGLLIITPKTWSAGPNPDDLTTMLGYDEAEFKEWVGEVFKNSVEGNKNILAKRAAFLGPVDNIPLFGICWQEPTRGGAHGTIQSDFPAMGTDRPHAPQPGRQTRQTCPKLPPDP